MLEKVMSFNGDVVQSISVKLAWPQIELFLDDVAEIQVLAAGDEHTVSELKMAEKEGKLSIEQPTYGISMDITNGKWMQVVVRVPRKWQGSVEMYSISGTMTIRNIKGRDLLLDTVSGDVRAIALDGINITLKSVSGRIKAGELKGEKLHVRTVSGDVDMQSSTFEKLKLATVSGRMAIEMEEMFERIDATSVSGEIDIHSPVQTIQSTLRSLSGRIRTNGVALSEEGPVVNITSVSANISLINTSI